METGYILTGLVLLLLILGSLLFLAAQFLVHKVKKGGQAQKRLWVWRSFLLILVVYVVALVPTHRGLINEIFPGPLSIIPTVILIIFLGSMIEISIIDMLLPDVIKMWKRITIEILGFVLLCSVSFYAFTAGLRLLSMMV